MPLTLLILSSLPQVELDLLQVLLVIGFFSTWFLPRLNVSKFTREALLLLLLSDLLLPLYKSPSTYPSEISPDSTPRRVVDQDGQFDQFINPPRQITHYYFFFLTILISLLFFSLFSLKPLYSFFHPTIPLFLPFPFFFRTKHILLRSHPVAPRTLSSQ